MQVQKVQKSGIFSYYISTKKANPICSTRILWLRSFVISRSTNTQIKWPKGLSNVNLFVAESIQIGVPMLLAMEKMIFGLQYSWERPGILIQTYTNVYFDIVGAKYFDQGKSLRIPCGSDHAFTDLALWMSLSKENVNSKNPLPRDVTPYFPIDGQCSISFNFILTIVRGVNPLDQTTLPWRWCLQASTPILYSSSGIVMASLSPFKQACGNWLTRMS